MFCTRLLSVSARGLAQREGLANWSSRINRAGEAPVRSAVRTASHSAAVVASLVGSQLVVSAGGRAKRGGLVDRSSRVDHAAEGVVLLAVVLAAQFVAVVAHFVGGQFVVAAGKRAEGNWLASGCGRIYFTGESKLCFCAVVWATSGTVVITKFIICKLSISTNWIAYWRYAVITIVTEFHQACGWITAFWSCCTSKLALFTWWEDSISTNWFKIALRSIVTVR